MTETKLDFGNAWVTITYESDPDNALEVKIKLESRHMLTVVLDLMREDAIALGSAILNIVPA